MKHLSKICYLATKVTIINGKHQKSHNYQPPQPQVNQLASEAS